MADSESIVTIFLSVVGILITLLIPIPIKDEYRLFTITIITFIFLLTILSRFNKRLKEKEEKIKNLTKRFKTIEELSDIRLDIRELKREVFKK